MTNLGTRETIYSVFCFFKKGLKMTEQEVRALLLENMSKAAIQDQAFCATHRMIAERIFEKVGGRIITQDAMMHLRMLADAKSRVGLYAFLQDGRSAIDKNIDFFRGFLNVVELIEEAMIFVENNYETLNIHRNTRRSRSEISTTLEEFKKWHALFSTQVEKRGKINFSGSEVQSLNVLIDRTMLLILGRELFKKFAEEFNQANAYLNRCIEGITSGQESAGVIQ